MTNNNVLLVKLLNVVDAQIQIVRFKKTYNSEFINFYLS